VAALFIVQMSIKWTMYIKNVLTAGKQQRNNETRIEYGYSMKTIQM